MRPPLLLRPEHSFYHGWTTPVLSSPAFLENSQTGFKLSITTLPACNQHLSVISLYTCLTACFSRSCVSGLQGANSTVPAYVCDLVQRRQQTRSLRSSTDGSLLTLPRTRTQYGDRAFSVLAPRHWNYRPSAIQNSTDYKPFGKARKTYNCLWITSLIYVGPSLPCLLNMLTFILWTQYDCVRALNEICGCCFYN